MIKIKFTTSKISREEFSNFLIDISSTPYTLSYDNISWKSAYCEYCIKNDTDASYLLLKYNFLSIV